MVRTGLGAPVALAGIFVAGLVEVLSVSTFSAREVAVLAVLLAVAAIAAAARRTNVAWEHIIALILVVVLFVPIDRYQLPGRLPFSFELYRVVIALCVLVWAGSLLVDSRVRLVR